MTKFKREKPASHGQLVNEQIRDNSLNVIGSNGEILNNISRRDALALAQESGLDLVKVGDKDGVAIAKIMDFGKFLYSKKKKLSQSKKNQKVIQIKEVKMRPNIGIGDYETKMKAAIRFLNESKRVKFTLQFRGRQPVSVHETGNKFFDRVKNDLLSAGLTGLVEEKESKSMPFWSKIFYIKS